VKVVAISGSPKAKNSVTVQSVMYLKKNFPDDEFEIIHVGNKVKKYSQKTAMDACIDAMANSDLILFAYPVYTFLATYQLANFIYHLKRNKNVHKLKGKFASQITTSKHFYDTTAHRYIIENCNDMGLKSITGIAADMDDLTLVDGRKQLKDFYNTAKFSVQNDIYHRTSNAKSQPFDYIYNGNVSTVEKSGDFDSVIVSDCKSKDVSLRRMIDNFKVAYPHPIKEVNIADFSFSGGCLGCFECATDGTCVYNDKFPELLRNEIQSADALILAGKIVDHSMGPIFKCYDDRHFCNGHRVMTKGKVTGYILDGNLSSEKNLLDLIEARSEVGHMYLCGVASNESKNDEQTSESIEKFAKSMAFGVQNKLERPQNFFGVGGTKIFRDLIFTMRGLMKEDHRFYKKQGVYDFPHKQRGLILKMKMVGLLMSIPAIKKKSRGMMNEIVLKPYHDAMEKE
jgi:multimeric flavodoxin WrbA